METIVPPRMRAGMAYRGLASALRLAPPRLGQRGARATGSFFLDASRAIGILSLPS